MATTVKDSRKKQKYKSYKRPKKTISAGELLYRIVAGVLALSLVVSYLSVFVNPTKMWVPMFFGLYYIPILLVNLVMLLVGLWRRRISLLIPLVALLPSIFVINQFAKVGNEEKVYEGDRVKVLTYNLGRYEAASRNLSKQQTISGIRTFILEQDADIVCLQEFKAADAALLSKMLPDYPFRAYYFFKGKDYFGNVTLSKYQIVESEAIKFKKSTNLCLESDIKIGKRILSIYNCHLESNAVSFTALIKRLGDDSFFSDDLMGLHEKVKDATLRRAAQVDSLLRREASESTPSIVCGDLNDTPLSYTYHSLSRRKSDSFVEAGKGLSSTYSKFWPLLRVDYILLPKEYNVSRHEITRIPYSDHYPVTAEIYFEDE